MAGAIVASVDLDHQAFLGSDRETIGFEKAGIFRAAQEALRNALNHAQAKTVTLCLRRSPTYITLSVIDDGCGFRVPARLSELARRGHFGLVGIAERVAWAGGELTIHSNLGTGTEVIVHVPNK